jgi:hypothetical protein
MCVFRRPADARIGLRIYQSKGGTGSSRPGRFRRCRDQTRSPDPHFRDCILYWMGHVASGSTIRSLFDKRDA